MVADEYIIAVEGTIALGGRGCGGPVGVKLLPVFPMFWGILVPCVERGCGINIGVVVAVSSGCIFCTSEPTKK